MQKPWYSYLYVKSPVVKILIGILSVVVSIVLLLIMGIIEQPRMQAQTDSWEGRSIEKGAELYANNCASCHGLDGQGGAGPALHSRYFFLQRTADVGFTGSLEDYIELTVAAGRPSKANAQWGVIMPTWSSSYGGPMRDDQVVDVTQYVLNWEESALAQTADEDPWIAFQDTPSRGMPEDVAAGGEAGADAGPRAPEVLFTTMGCVGCHNLDLPQDDTNRGPVGPNLGNLAENAQTRVAGQSAEEYVHNSIVNPNAYVVEGYLANIMTQNFAQQMSEEEINSMVEWLLDPNRSQ